MIFLHELEQGRKYDFNVRLSHSPDVFEEARDFYRHNDDRREEWILVVNQEDAPLYALSWSSNNIGVFGGKHRDMIHVSEFWGYNVFDGRLDFDLLRRGQVFIFDTLEEYSYQIARIIRANFPDKFIFFLDPRARYFFQESDCLHVLNSLAEFYNGYRYFISKSVYHINSDLEFHFDAKMFLQKRCNTLQMMEGLFWKTNTARRGTLHPEKTFYLIQNPVGMQGLVDVVKFALFRAMMVARRHGHIIPVIELAEKGDGNQFNGGNGENIWTMFFEQLTDIPLEEVHQSRNVILGREHQLMFNPYLLEEFYYEDWALMFRKFLRYNRATQMYIDRLTAKVVPEDPGRVLGIIGRGTDYNSSQTEGVLGTPLTGPELVEKARALVEEKGFDRIFLATEDQSVFDAFANSPLADRMFYVPQPRIDYADSKNNDKLLVDIYAQEERDGYQDTLRYLGILDILAKHCDALIASVDCGAYYYAVALNDGRYEFAEAYANTKQR